MDRLMVASTLCTIAALVSACENTIDVAVTNAYAESLFSLSYAAGETQTKSWKEAYADLRLETLESHTYTVDLGEETSFRLKFNTMSLGDVYEFETGLCDSTEITEVKVTYDLDLATGGFTMSFSKEAKSCL